MVQPYQSMITLAHIFMDFTKSSMPSLSVSNLFASMIR